jgi:hypothetical protein
MFPVLLLPATTIVGDVANSVPEDSSVVKFAPKVPKFAGDVVRDKLLVLVVWAEISDRLLDVSEKLDSIKLETCSGRRDVMPELLFACILVVELDVEIDTAEELFKLGPSAIPLAEDGGTVDSVTAGTVLVLAGCVLVLPLLEPSVRLLVVAMLLGLISTMLLLPDVFAGNDEVAVIELESVANSDIELFRAEFVTIFAEVADVNVAPIFIVLDSVVRRDELVEDRRSVTSKLVGIVMVGFEVMLFCILIEVLVMPDVEDEVMSDSAVPVAELDVIVVSVVMRTPFWHWLA